MKSERRHQLQHNELADQIEKARHWLEPYLIPGLLAVTAISLVFAGYSYFSTLATNERSQATFDLLFGTRVEPGVGEDAEAYERIAKDFPGEPAAQIASLLMADQLLQKGIDALYRDRDEAKGLLADAESGYREVLANTKENLLKTRAQYGLAMTLESQGKISEAEEAYKGLLEFNESKEMDQWVEQRLASLKQPQAKEFVDWFSEQKPTAFTPSTAPGLPSGDLLPDSPDILAPSVQTPETAGPSPTLGEQLQLGGGSGEPMKENPAVEAPPATETPAEEAPSSEPAAEVPPVTETPEETPQSTDTPAPAVEAPAVEEPAPVSPEEPAPVAPEEPAPATPEEPATGTDETPTPAGEEPAVEPSGDAPTSSSGGSF